MDPIVWFDQNLEDALGDHGHRRGLIKKLIHLIVTKPDITSVVGVLSRYLRTPHQCCLSCFASKGGSS